MPDPHPQDVLSECVAKLVFLADTLSIYSFHKEVNISPQGLSGLCQIVSDIEKNLSAVSTCLFCQSPKGV